MNEISDELIRETLSPYSFIPADSQCQAIKSYISLLLRWNKRVSLTTITHPIEVLRFHFGESLYAAICVPMLNGRLADLGSGAGFPGLPLRLAIPGLSLTMIESNMKKAAFLREVVRELELAGVEIVRNRMESIPGGGARYDFVTARALGNHAEILKLSLKHLNTAGKVILWLGAEDVNRVSADSQWKWTDPVHIPGTERRFILAGSPAK